MRKRVIPLLAMFLMLALMPVNIAAHTADDPFVTDLIADGGDEATAVDVGDIEIWNDGDYLYVKYVTDGSWTILKTHLHVTAIPDEIPQTRNGNPIPGRFEYHSTELFDDGVTEKLYTIPLDWDCGTEIYIAAHARVVSTIEKMTFSEPGVAAFGPVGEYYGLDDPMWGSSNPAVATWVHPSWPSIPDATWISTAYYVEEPIVDSWRKFQTEIELPESGYYVTGSVVTATSDNAEEVYFNGVLVGSDGEVQGSFIDDHEWNTIVEYPVTPVPGTNSLEFIVRNYGLHDTPTSAPTGLIYSAYFDCYRKETAWGDGFESDGNNWATYIAYTIQEPYKFWNLPDDPVQTWIDIHPGSSNNYFDMQLVGVGDGFDISDDVWPAWCADSYIYIYSRDYTATVYSSYDPNLPTWASDDEQWDYINYILNHKHPNAAMMDIQQAIWYFADTGYPMPTDSEAAAMVNDALANGAGFKPVAGQIGAVILAIGADVQLVFIEVDP